MLLKSNWAIVEPAQAVSVTSIKRSHFSCPVIENINWCIDGKYRIYVARLRNWIKMSFSESCHPFHAEPHKFYIYHQYTNIVFILQKCNKMSSNVLLESFSTENR
jgi:hypothetical protein